MVLEFALQKEIKEIGANPYECWVMRLFVVDKRFEISNLNLVRDLAEVVESAR